MANFSLLAKLGVDTKAFSKGLAKAQKRSASFGKRLKKSFGGVKGALLGIAGIGAFGTSIKGSLQLADSLKKTADRLGLTTDELQDFTNAAKLSGIETTTASLGLQRYVRRLAEAQAGTGELKGILEEYNIEVRNTDGTNKDAMVVLGELADIMKGNTSQADNLRIAFKAFDSEGADLVRILDAGADGFEELAKKGNQAFGVFSQSNVEALSEAKTNLESLGRSATIVSGKLIEFFGIDKMVKNFAQAFTGIPVTPATDFFEKAFDPSRPTELINIIFDRLKEGTGRIEGFDIKELFSEKDLEKVAEQILKIQGAIRDVPSFSLTRQENRGIKELVDSLIKIQKAEGKAAITKKIQDAIEARILEKKQASLTIAKEDRMETLLAKKLEEDIEKIKNRMSEKELDLLKAKASGNEKLINQEESNIRVLEVMLELMEDHNVQRSEALDLAQQIVAEERKAADNKDDDNKFEAEKNKIKEEELKLIKLSINGTEEEIEKQKKKIELMERIIELQEKFDGMSRDEATRIAKGEAGRSNKDAIKGTGIGDVPTRKLDDIANAILKDKGKGAGDFFQQRSTSDGTVFDRYTDGSRSGTFSEADMRKAIGDEALKEKDDKELNVLEEIKDVLEGKFVSE